MSTLLKESSGANLLMVLLKDSSVQGYGDIGTSDPLSQKSLNFVGEKKLSMRIGSLSIETLRKAMLPRLLMSSTFSS